MDILTWLDGTQFWHWWILALIFAGIEILAPGVFFIWLGAAAGLTGLIALVIPGMGWEIEALIFALLASGSLANILGAKVRPPLATTFRPSRVKRASNAKKTISASCAAATISAVGCPWPG